MEKQVNFVGGNDIVQTPDALAFAIVKHFLPQITGTVLEPCAGGGAFLRAFKKCGLKKVKSCEIEAGTDFFDFTEHVSWIITNPPWSKARKWLQHSYEIADDVVVLITTLHVLGLRARLRDIDEAGFGIREVLLCTSPPAPWPQSGFQLAAIHLSRGWADPLRLHRLVEVEGSTHQS